MKTVAISVVILVFTLTACQKRETFPSPADIINSPDKVEIEISDLPTNAISFIHKNYPQKYIVDAKVVPAIGFEVGMRDGIGWSIGKYSTIHFIINSPAQFISATNLIKQDECFELRYPITYLMKDGTEITGDNVTTKTKIKAWYKENPEEKEAAEIKYPFEIIYADSSILTINNEEEKEAACN